MTRTTAVVLVALSALVHAQGPPPPPPIAKGTNVLSGRLLDIGTDAPIGGAAVMLTALTMDRFEAERTGQRLPARNVMTTADGYFVFRELPAGKYSIVAAAFGYVKNEYPAKLVDVVDGDKPATIALRLWKQGAISGRIVDERGEPVVGVPVTAMRRTAMAGELLLVRDAVLQADTDDRGEYRLAPLAPGSYVVGVMASATSVPASLAADVDAVAGNPQAEFNLRSRLGLFLLTTGAGLRQGDDVLQRSGPPPVLSPDGRVLAYSTSLFPGTPRIADATVITLSSGESRTGVDVPIRFTRAVRVSGVITAPAALARPLTVQLLPPNAADITDGNPHGAFVAVTDMSGRFTFLAVPAGPYVLKTSLFDRNERSPAPPLWARQTLTVGDTDITGLTLTLTHGTRMSGRIEFAGTDAATAVGAGRMTVIPHPIAAGSWSPSTGEVRPDGTFTTGGDPPGLYDIFVASATNWQIDGIFRGGKALADSVIELGADDLTDLVVKVSKAPRRLIGTIDVQGARDSEFDVIAFPADTVLWRQGVLQNRRAQLAHGGSTGRFEFTTLAPGEYYVTAVSARLTTDWKDPQFLELLIPGAVKVTLDDAGDKAVALRAFTPKGR